MLFIEYSELLLRGPNFCEAAKIAINIYFCSCEICKNTNNLSIILHFTLV